MIRMARMLRILFAVGFLASVCSCSAVETTRDALCKQIIDMLGHDKYIQLKDYPKVELHTTDNQCIFRHSGNGRMPFGEENIVYELTKVIKDYVPRKMTRKFGTE